MYTSKQRSLSGLKQKDKKEEKKEEEEEKRRRKRIRGRSGGRELLAIRYIVTTAHSPSGHYLCVHSFSPQDGRTKGYYY